MVFVQPTAPSLMNVWQLTPSCWNCPFLTICRGHWARFTPEHSCWNSDVRLHSSGLTIWINYTTRLPQQKTCWITVEFEVSIASLIVGHRLNLLNKTRGYHSNMHCPPQFLPPGRGQFNALRLYSRAMNN